jgi:hypothetical protein
MNAGAVSRIEWIFEVDRHGINMPRGSAVTAVLLVPFLVLAVIGHERYWLSLSFGALFVGLSDSGGSYSVHFQAMAAVGLTGTLLTALGSRSVAVHGGLWSSRPGDRHPGAAVSRHDPETLRQAGRVADVTLSSTPGDPLDRFGGIQRRVDPASAARLVPNP